MLDKSWPGLLLIVMLAPAPAVAQSRTERNSEAVERQAGESGSSGSVLNLDQVKEQIVALTNAFRAENKRPELKVNAKLDKAAKPFADYMAQNDKFSHTADGKEPWERVANAGYGYCIVLENIAYEFNAEGFSTRELAERFVQSWKDSPEHRKNMLDPDVDEIGVGVARSSNTGRYYAVQDFGRPKSEAITFKMANMTDVPVKITLDGKSSSLSPRHIVTYERCRPAEVQVQPAGTSKPGSKTQPKVVRPKNGSSYVIRKDENGTITIDKQ